MTTDAKCSFEEVFVKRGACFEDPGLSSAVATLPSLGPSGRLSVSIVLKSADGYGVMASFPSCIFEGLHRKIHAFDSVAATALPAADAKRRSINLAFP